MKDILTFKRIETKYLISRETKDILFSKIKDHLIEDEHGFSKISSLYLDTPTYLLIRNSMDGKIYKEKLRIRGYNEINENSKVFLEIKKKFNKVVYKRRIKCTYTEALNYINHHHKIEESQIMNEIDYAFNFYNFPQPTFLITYNREAYYLKEDINIRITFDSKVSYNKNNLDLTKSTMNKQILDDETFIMEIKSSSSIPLWLVHILNELEIRPCSYSKYKNSYIDYIGG